MQRFAEERRKYPRYDTDVKIEFRVPYDLTAEVDFKITEEMIEGRDRTYVGFSKNISVHGLSFESFKRLEIGDLLWMDLHLPKSDKVVFMQGEVCWCRSLESSMEQKPRFQTGVQIAKVDGLDVEQTVYFDKTYGVIWSELLERVLGGLSKISRKNFDRFRCFMKKKYALVLRGVLEDPQGRFLLMQRSLKSKGWPGKWEFPGGKVDRGEELTDALIREWKEETGLAVVPVECLDVFDWERENDRILYLVFRVRARSFNVKLSPEHDDFAWFTVSQIKKLDVAPSLKRVVRVLCA